MAPSSAAPPLTRPPHHGGRRSPALSPDLPMMAALGHSSPDMAGGAQAGPEPARVVEALELLLGPPSNGDNAAEPGPETALCPETLRRNAAALEERLSGAAGWAALRELRAAVLSRAPALAAGVASTEPGWAAACGLLALLLCLKERLAALAASPSATPAAPGAPPPPGADTLSVGQERAVRRAVRAAVGLGLLPHLPSELGPGPGPGPGLGPPPSTRGIRLFAVVAALVELARLPALGAPLLARHLRLLLFGLCGLGHGPAALCQGISEAERAQCREALRDILDRVYQPLAVQELLVLQGQPKQRSLGARAAPAWLRRLCGHLLSERLLRPGGVQAVVRGILEGTDGGASAEAAALDWRKCDAVGKILAACPQQCLSLEDYYRQVCPQILDLLHIQDKVAARQFQRVATTTLLTMAREQPQLAEKHLLQPLLAPLRRCSEAAELALEDLTAGAVLVPEAELGSCVEDVLKVYVVGNDSSSLLLGSLQSVLGVVFSLYSFAKQNVSYLRSPCQDILLWFLEKAEREQSLAVLKGLARLSSHVPTLHPQCQLRVGSEGGAAIVLEEATSDEDEALYQKISLEQCHVESLVELLSHCQKSGLAGDFFIHCLKELTQVAAEDEAAPNPAVQPAGSLLELEQSQARQGRKLLVLQLVAALCEGVSDTVFTDIVQVQEFLAAVLHRACAHPAQGPGAAAEAQTLAMAMGLVAAVLGGAVQLKSSDFAVLKRLVPLLEELSRTYPDPLTQELASDLRIAICTHGACSPGTVGSAADSVLGRKPGMAELLVSAYDPQPPSRAAALRHLASLVTQRDPEALRLQEKLLQVFLENVQHEDAFVYLSAIQGIALLSSEYPERILPVLLAQYERPAQGTEDAMAAVTRMKLGEVLMRVTRALGDMVFQHREPLIRAFLRGARDPDSALRASSLSNLGELCQHLGFQLGSIIQEVTCCVTAIARTDPEAEVRRAAVHVVVVLLRGLSEKVTEVLQDVLRDLYRLLKHVVTAERDAATVLHAQLALEELDTAVRRVLFPPQTLEKKIVVLP
ncbi:PREDICTED: transport and Golgi organization protein 6 homolog [Sturnus vulgaris]|uniref:transport and Golgi organization protein 6 homolog n=1 Tax=Sturnus vulgaris TaxID=9172 RepID=UPI00071A02FE|nr:PREDICTED: transport and Golgi organization protein 6 homolog [Sturnus vulgaris]